MAPAVAAALISAAPSVIKGISGIFQGAKGRKLAKQNVRPTYEIPKEFQQNLAIAENMGRVGLPQQQYNQAQQNFQRNQAGALRQFGRMGNPRGLAGIVRAGNDATMNLDVADAQARLANQRAAMGYRGQMGQQQLAKQQWDKFGKYQENAAAASALMGAGRQNVMGGLSELSQVGQMYMYGNPGGGSNEMPNLGDASTGAVPTVGNYESMGQYGTRLGGTQNNSFGSRFQIPPSRYQLPFSPKFIPKKF
jgi:hypothetical protein